MNMHLHKCSHNLMIPMHRKFSDEIFARFLVIMKNVVISFIKEKRGPTLRPPSDVIDDAILSSRQTFLPKVIPEVEYTRKIAMSIAYILSF